MSIVCGLDPTDPSSTALAVATAIGRRRNQRVVQISGGAERLADAAHGEAAELLVVGTSAPVDWLARHAAVPLLVVRDAEPFLAWAAGARPLRLVLGWDETANTVAALHLVRALRAAGAVDVTIVHVYYPDEAARQYGVRRVSMVEPSAELETFIVRDIAHRLAALPGDGALVIVAARGLGRIGDHLTDAAEHHRADLIVVGNHHRGRLRKLSSVAAVVLHDAAQSVLCVPLRASDVTDEVPAFRIAMVATDGSAFASRAIPYAFALLPEHGELHLIQVVNGDDHGDDAALAAAMLALPPASRPDVIAHAHVVHDGDVAHAIATAAERVGADVVCIASHARVGIARALAGSLTDRLLHVCHRPVLVLHLAE